jgi:hypothetical protein
MKTPSTLSLKITASVTAVLLSGVPCYGQLAASATISAVPDGANFNYTLLLTNTGTFDIGTFWFAWTPAGQPFPIEYDFLPTSPLSADGPTGWTGFISKGFPGYSIQYYNVSGTALVAGQTDTFHFTSADSPQQLQNSTFGLANITSFIYSGVSSPGDTPAGETSQVNPVFVTVPEPASFAFVSLGLVGLAAMRRQRMK